MVVLFLALLIRGGTLWMTPGALEGDPDGYRLLAENLVAHGTLGMEPQSPRPLGEGQGEGVVHPQAPPALTLALSQRERGPAPTAFRPPLYPLLLSGCAALGDYSRAAIGVLHVALGVATVGLVLVLGRWWGLGNRAAALAAMLVACDPILLSQSAQVMTETPAALLATAGLAALTALLRRQLNCRPESNGNGYGSTTAAPTWMAILAGAVLALGALCRSTLLLWTIATGVLAAYEHWRWSDACRRRLQTPIDRPSNESATGVASYRGLPYCVAFALSVLIVLSPWAIRNQIQFGRPIVTTTHGGYTLLLANNPEFYEWLRSGQWGGVWRADRFNADWARRKPVGEVQADRLAYAEARQTIRREPGTFAYACLVRIGRFWSPLPHQVVDTETPLRRLARYAVAAWYAAEFLLAAIGLWRVSRGARRGLGGSPPSEVAGSSEIIRKFKTPNPQSLIPNPSVHPSSFIIHHCLLLVLCLSAVHAVYWTDMRMRAPLMPVVALAAAVGLCGLLPTAPAVNTGGPQRETTPRTGQ